MFRECGDGVRVCAGRERVGISDGLGFLFMVMDGDGAGYGGADAERSGRRVSCVSRLCAPALLPTKVEAAVAAGR